MADITVDFIYQKWEYSHLLFLESDFHCTVQIQRVSIPIKKGFARIYDPCRELTGYFMFPLLEFM